MHLETRIDAAPSITASQNPRARLMGLLHPERRAILFVLALTVAGGVLSAAEPVLMKAIFDRLEPGNASALALLALALLLTALLREAGVGVANWLSWRTRLRTHHRLLEVTVGRLQTLPLTYHQKECVGGVMTKLDRGIQGLLGALHELAFTMLSSLVYLTLAIGVMLELDVRMTVLVVGFACAPPLIGYFAAPEQVEREKKLLDRWARIYGRFNEVLSGIVTVKSFAMEESERRRFLAGVADANRLVTRGVAIDSVTGAGRGMAVALARLATIGLGAWLVAKGEMTVGTVLAFLGYIGGLFAPVQGLSGMFQAVKKAKMSLEILSEILDAEDNLLDAPNAVALEAVRGEVALERVYFSYGRSSLVLRGVSLEAAPGEVVALVGPSGSGKSTIMALLQRLYDPASGQVRIDGLDLRRVRQASLRAHIGVVLQEAVLFDDTVRNNIAYGRPSASFEAIVEAARAANADHFIRELERGYATQVGERGKRLSVGQRQRISIARALLKDPRILILDEATSALDAESEFLIQEALARLVTGRTTFVIAHRLSTVIRADRIYVLKHGEIIEQGTHSALLEAGGYYAMLVEKQLGARARAPIDLHDVTPQEL